MDRVHGTPHSIGPGVVMGDWSPSGNYSVGDIVYDVTFNSCCSNFVKITLLTSLPLPSIASFTALEKSSGLNTSLLGVKKILKT